MQAHSNAIIQLDQTGNDMIQHGHYASQTIRKRLDELHALWEQLLKKLGEKGGLWREFEFVYGPPFPLKLHESRQFSTNHHPVNGNLFTNQHEHNNVITHMDLLHPTIAGLRLQQALKLVQFNRQCDEVMYWIRDKVSVFTMCTFDRNMYFRRKACKLRFD